MLPSASSLVEAGPAESGHSASSFIVRSLDEANIGRWDAFVLSSPQASFFHRAGWRSVIERCFGQRCHYLFAERDGAIRGILPLTLVRSRIFGTRLVATGWCVGGGVVADEPGAAEALDEAAEALLRSSPAQYIEYRDPPVPHQGSNWQRKDTIYATFERPILLKEEDCLKAIPRKQRAVVRKALESKLEFRFDATIDSFYRLYALSMRNLGTPVFGRNYIAALKATFGADCDILTVYEGERPLSSVLNFYFRDRAMPYYTGADPVARSVGAADLMYWHVMRAAAARGYTIFDFGRSKLGTGPYAFKKNWGFEPRAVIHEFLLKAGTAMPEINPNNPKYRAMIGIWRRLPLPVANLLGPWIGRQVG